MGDSARAVLEFASGAKRGAVVVTHTNADPDAAASALMLRAALLSLGVREVQLAFPEGPSRLSRKLLRELKLHVEYVSTLSDTLPASVAVVDASNCNQLGPLCSHARLARNLLVMDHHVPPGDLARIASHSVVRREPATVVLVYEAVKSLGVKLDPQLLTLALAGLIFDSKRFIHVSPSALRAAAEIVEEGGVYHRALALLEEEADFSERVARLKGAMRCGVLRVGNWLIAISEVGSFEASVARSLISLGADVAIVASERQGECRLSIRLSRALHSGVGLSVGRDIMPMLTERLKGRGGGHDMAGGFNGRCRASEALREALNAVIEALGAPRPPRPLR